MNPLGKGIPQPSRLTRPLNPPKSKNASPMIPRARRGGQPPSKDPTPNQNWREDDIESNKQQIRLLTVEFRREREQLREARNRKLYDINAESRQQRIRDKIIEVMETGWPKHSKEVQNLWMRFLDNEVRSDKEHVSKD